MEIATKHLLTDIVSRADGDSMIERVDSLQQVMLNLPQVKCEVIHRFAPNLYIREVSIPAGTMAIGHWQRFEHLNVLLKGKVRIMHDDGSTELLEAPMMFVGKPGRKVGYIEEDMVWQNIYSTSERDVEKLEAHFLDKDKIWHAHLDEVKQKLLPCEDDHNDFLNMLDEFGLDLDFAKRESEREDNMCELPAGTYKIKVGDSHIHGKGLFATADIKAGETICPARIGDLRTIAGRYTNHSARPNACMVRVGHKEINLVALRDIDGCTGGHDGEEITIDYRVALRLAVQINQEN